MSSRPAVRIRADVPLLCAGLERLARSAGIDVVGDPPPDGAVEVTFSGDAVLIACRRPPDPATWAALDRLVHLALPTP